MIEVTNVFEAATLELLKRADGASWDPEKTCLSSTRTDLIKDLVEFAASSAAQTPHRILLVVGVLGCGKSAIAHSVSERCHMADPRVLGASFMFSREVEGRGTPVLLVSTIAYSLCGRYPDFARAISAVIEEDRSILSAPISRQFRSLLVEPMKRVSASIPHPISIVIDALDEGCDDGSDAALLKALANDGDDLPPNFRIIITSRPMPKIMIHLANKPHIDVREIELLSDRNLEDVALFARHSLAEIREKRGLPPSWPGEELSNKFIRKAEGLFIWVSTTCAFMLNAANPTRQLERLTGDQYPSSLGSEAKMALLYTAVLAACPWGDEDFVENYQLLLGTLRTPLSPLAIKSLLAVDIPITDTLRSLSPVLMGVTNTRDGDRPLQILHDSFRAYSTRQDMSTLSSDEQRYTIDVAAHNQRLALEVLRFLNHHLPPLKHMVREINATMRSDKSQGIPSPPFGSITEGLW